MLVNDFLGNGKAQSCAAGFSGACLVHPVKPLENTVPILRWDADAVVRHLHPDAAARLPGRNGDSAPVGSVFYGVGHHIHHHLKNPFPVCSDGGQSFRDIQREPVPVPLCLQKNGVVKIPQGCAEGEGGQMDGTSARIEAG